MPRLFERSERHLRVLGLLCAGALLAGGAAEAAPTAARVTATTGSSLSDGEAVEHRGSLEDGDGLETGDDGNSALLLDEDALMELCSSTSVRLERREGRPDGPRVVKLERGTIRMVVEPRLGEERIEIHTPAAIATILGTIGHVSVNAVGVTTVTTESAKLLVKSIDPNVAGETVVEAGQQVVIAPGEAPGPAKRLDRQEVAALGGCLIDFHAVALEKDRNALQKDKLDQLVAETIADAEGPVVSAGRETRHATNLDELLNKAAGDPTSPYGVLTQVETGAADDALTDILLDAVDPGPIVDDGGPFPTE